MYERLNYIVTSLKNKRPTFILNLLYALNKHRSATAINFKMCMGGGQLPSYL